MLSLLYLIWFDAKSSVVVCEISLSRLMKWTLDVLKQNKNCGKNPLCELVSFLKYEEQIPLIHVSVYVTPSLYYYNSPRLKLKNSHQRQMKKWIPKKSITLKKSLIKKKQNDTHTHHVFFFLHDQYFGIELESSHPLMITVFGNRNQPTKLPYDHVCNISWKYEKTKKEQLFFYEFLVYYL